MKYDNEQKNILINQLKNKIDNEKYEREREQLLYKTIIDKYNEYFKAIDIKFADIEFESLGLT